MKTKHAVYLGELDFPVGLAAVQRCRWLCKALVETGFRTTVLIHFGTHNPQTTPGLASMGEWDGIRYLYTGGMPYKPRTWAGRFAGLTSGLVKEAAELVRLKRETGLEFGILSTAGVFQAVFYAILARWLRFPLLFNYVELYSAFENRTSMPNRIGDASYDKLIPRLVDGFLPISDYLIEILERRAPGRPYLKVPVVCDMQSGPAIPPPRGRPYFLFCGSALYFDAVEFVLSSFNRLEAYNADLILVLNGQDGPMARIAAAIERCPRKSRVRVRSRLSDTELASAYAGASGLLIPLKPSLRDRARFPHKIGEYAASGNPIISTAYGEIPHYFEDGESAFIAKANDPELFAEKMKLVLENPEFAQEVGRAGRRVGLKHFDYRKYGPLIADFAASLKRRG